MPVYGLAECSVALCFPPPGRGPRVDRVARAPSRPRAAPRPRTRPTRPRCVRLGGTRLPEHEVRIVDDAGEPVAERRVGRLVFRGPSMTSGYFRKPEATAAITLPGGWLDSGDLAYRASGEIHVCGRRKDLIIKGGRNLVPQEIEEAAAAVEGIRRGCVVAFGVPNASLGTEGLVVVAETRVEDETARERLVGAVTERVALAVEVPPDQVVLVPPGTVPKTSSGKVRRAATRELYLRGDLGRPPRTTLPQKARLAASALAEAAPPRPRARPRGLYAAWLALSLPLLLFPAWVLVVLVPGRRFALALSRFSARLRPAAPRLPSRGRGPGAAPRPRAAGPGLEPRLLRRHPRPARAPARGLPVRGQARGARLPPDRGLRAAQRSPDRRPVGRAAERGRRGARGRVAARGRRACSSSRRAPSWPPRACAPSAWARSWRRPPRARPSSPRAARDAAGDARRLVPAASGPDRPVDRGARSHPRARGWRALVRLRARVADGHRRSLRRAAPRPRGRGTRAPGGGVRARVSARVRLEDVEAARATLARHLRETPAAAEPRRPGTDLRLKLECWQPTGSFKVRGATNFLSTLSGDGAARAASWPRPRATTRWAWPSRSPASRERSRATLFVPRTAPRAKIREAPAVSRWRSARRARRTTTPPRRRTSSSGRRAPSTCRAYEDVRTAAGQGTIGLEILDQCPDVAAVLVPVGGGGLIAGVAAAVKAKAPGVRIVAVQPEASPALRESLRLGRALLSYPAGAHAGRRALRRDRADRLRPPRPPGRGRHRERGGDRGRDRGAPRRRPGGGRGLRRRRGRRRARREGRERRARAGRGGGHRREHRRARARAPSRRARRATRGLP